MIQSVGDVQSRIRAQFAQRCLRMSVVLAAALLAGCGDHTADQVESDASKPSTSELPVLSLDAEGTGEKAPQLTDEQPPATVRLRPGDTNGDGRLSKEEFIALGEQRAKLRTPKPEPTEKELRRLRERDAPQPLLKGQRTVLLRKFDHDRSGNFSPEEKIEAQAWLDEQAAKKAARMEAMSDPRSR